MKRSEFSLVTGLTNRQIRWLTDNKRIPFTRLENGYFEFDDESITAAKGIYQPRDEDFHIASVRSAIPKNSICMITRLGLTPKYNEIFIKACCDLLIKRNAQSLTVDTSFHPRGVYIAIELAAFCLANNIHFSGGRNA